MTEKPDRIDVAVNIFAKPFRTSLALLSLLRQCGQHIGKLWLQFEPAGIGIDPFPAYCIRDYLEETGAAECIVTQPQIWLAREAVRPGDFDNPVRKDAIRYQYAFENSAARLLFIMHNDIFVLKDILGAMRRDIGDAFAIGQLGQCWNCPAGNSAITGAVLGRTACTPDNYLDFRPGYDQLCALYGESHKQGIFARPYDQDGFTPEFRERPWPLPECRINEWACLLNLEQTRNLCAPKGSAYPPGAYRQCGEFNLDIGVPWFRDMHALGLKAKNFDIGPYIVHWQGTGNNTPTRYAKGEDKALSLLRRHFAPYVRWLEARYGKLPA